MKSHGGTELRTKRTAATGLALREGACGLKSTVALFQGLLARGGRARSLPGMLALGGADASFLLLA